MDDGAGGCGTRGHHRLGAEKHAGASAKCEAIDRRRLFSDSHSGQTETADQRVNAFSGCSIALQQVPSRYMRGYHNA